MLWVQVGPPWAWAVTWSISQARAGRGHQGKAQVLVAQLSLFGEPVGDLVGGHVDVLGEVDDRFDHDLGLGVGAPGADLVGGDQPVVVLHPRDLQADRRVLRWGCR